MWCNGNSDSKIKEFWDLIQGKDIKTIAHSDRELKKAFKDMVKISTHMVFDYHKRDQINEKIIIVASE